MRRRLCLAALVTAAAMALPVNAAATLVPGTPVAVPPGVPGHGRGWELVTPSDPVSAQLVTASALAGDRLFYSTLGPLPGAPPTKALLAPAFAVRGADGWVGTPVAVPVPESDFEAPLPEALSPDLATSIWTSDLLLKPGESEPGRGLFRRAPDGQFTLLAEIGGNGRLVGTSADLQHIVFTSARHLLAADADRSSGKSIYEIAGSDLRLVDVGADGSLLSTCGSTVPAANAISRDGGRIFFVTRPTCAGRVRVYMRVNGATTTEISASQCDLADCGPEQDVSFVGATPAGSSAFLVTQERLTDDDLNTYADLYRYDVGSGELTLLSAAPNGIEVDVEADPVQMSADGSRAYFRATPRSGPDQGKGPALYLAGEGGSRRVASAADEFLQASGDGRYVLFSSAVPLVGGDTDESVDIYRYDAVDDTLVRVSAGSGDGGNGPFDAEIAFDGVVLHALTHPYRAISEDGSRVFFSSAERLLPADRNQVADVYEWGSGSLGLISAGVGEGSASYFGASPDGDSALFMTSATLLPRDRDGGDLDFYIARVGGGFAEPPAAPVCGESPCRAPQGRVERALPDSAQPRRGILIRPPSAAARRSFVATGWITLLVEAPESGRLSAAARARIGGRMRTVAGDDVDVAEPGPVRLRMPLSKEAKGALAAGRDLHVRLRLRLSGLRSIRSLGFELRSPR